MSKFLTFELLKMIRVMTLMMFFNGNAPKCNGNVNTELHCLVDCFIVIFKALIDLYIKMLQCVISLKTYNGVAILFYPSKNPQDLTKAERENSRAPFMY